MGTALLLPALGAVALAWAIPWALSKALPEGVPALLLNAALSFALMGLAAAGYFLAAYHAESPALARALLAEPRAAQWRFGSLSLLSALLWAPVLVLSLAQIPGRWRHATW
jgi:hypothetical protein